MKHTITVRTDPVFRPARLALQIVAYVTLFGLGVLADSTAMQWFAFVVILIVAISAAIVITSERDGISTDAARKILDEIDRKDGKTAQ